jgi:hypothetical protein
MNIWAVTEIDSKKLDNLCIDINTSIQYHTVSAGLFSRLGHSHFPFGPGHVFYRAWRESVILYNRMELQCQNDYKH